jgi:HlyD family secretion protein
MPILALKKKDGDGSTPPTGDDVVLSAMDRRIEQKLITPQRIAIVVGSLLLIALSVYAYLEFGLNRTLTVGSERLTVSKVSYGTFREYIPVTGNVVPRTTVYIDAINGGQITAVHVEEGAFVKAGDPLVTFKNTQLQLQVITTESQAAQQILQGAQMEMSYDSTHASNQRQLIEVDYQIDRLTRDLNRKRPLVATGGATVGQIDDLEAELKRSQAMRVMAAEALARDEEFRKTQIESLTSSRAALAQNIAIARENLANLVLIAPITGQLTLLEANVGESKSGGARIGQLDEVNAFKVNAFVDEFYLSRVTIGQVATVDLDGKTYEVTVAKVYPDVRDRQFEIDLAFNSDAPQGIRRGQTLRMRLEIGQPADTLVLANGAFFDDTGGQWVFVVHPSGDYAERRDVRFGRRNPEGIEVLEGLRDGEQVITSSYESLMNFDRIQFRSEDS